MRAVDSEFRNGRLHDARRRYQVLRAAAAAGHPARKCGIGNAASLWERPTAAGVDVRAALLAFHGRHYSANRMALSLVAPAPLDTLASWAGDLFGGIPNTHAPLAADAYAGRPPYGPAETGVRLHVVPVEEHRWLSLFWVVPPLAATYRTNPVGYIAHRFNYGGPGSLLSALRSRGWASSVRASSSERATHWQTVQVWVELTVAGAAAAAIDEVIGAIFAYLRLLAAEGVTARSYQDAADIKRMYWTYREREEPSALARKLAPRMHWLPDEHLLTGESLYAAYDERLIRDTLRLLTPAAAVVMVVDPAFTGTTDRVEEWYGTPYSACRIPDDTLTAWAAAAPWPDLAVGPPNAFIPTDLSLVCDALDESAAGSGQPPAVGEDAGPTRAPGATAVLARVASAAPPADFNGDAAAVDAGAMDDAASTLSPLAAGAAAAAASPAAPPPWESPRLPPVVPPAAATTSAHPVLLHDDATLRLHYKLDRTFRRPKAYVWFNLLTPAVHTSARSWVLSDLATRVLADALTEETADAADAGLGVRVSRMLGGLRLFLSGYTDKLPRLLDVLLGHLGRFRAEPARFARVAEVLRRGYKNRLKQDPRDHATTTVSLLTCTPAWHLTDLLGVFGDGLASASSPPPAAGGLDGEGTPAPPTAPPPPSAAEVEAFVASLWPGGLFIEALVAGNVSPEGALSLAATVQAALPAPPLPALELPARRAVQLPARQTVLARIASPKPEDPNSAVQVVYQVGLGGDPTADVTLALLKHMLVDRVFTVLRTEQQLGYRVSSWSQRVAGVNVLCVAVQSPSASPETVAARIQACLDDFGSVTLPALDPTPFKTALSAALREPDKQLWAQARRYLDQISDHTYDYGRREALADALAAVGTPQLCRWWATYLAADAPRRRLLVSAVHPPGRPPVQTPAEERAAGAGGEGGGGGGDGGSLPPPLVLADVAAHPAAVRAFRHSRPLYPVNGYYQVGPSADPGA